MPSLSEKLKSLGVKVGGLEPPPSPTRSAQTVERALGGQAVQTRHGETFVVEERYPAGLTHGRAGLELSAPLQALADWAGEARVGEMPPQAFAFLDTETTGLAGGTGTFAFLVGVGRFEGEEFRLAQFFMRDPSEETAQLLALEDFLAPCEAVVTFNGKAFDVPLLHTRFRMHGWRAPFPDLAHVDLLHLARRLWRERLASRTLGNLEVQILGASRSEEDVPGWMIPELYRDYLRDGDPQPLKRVFYHNAMDVVSLAALMNHMAGLLDNPLALGGEYGADLIALAKLFEDLGRLDTATRLYVHGLEHEDARTERLPKELLLQAIQRLALIYKRREELGEAIDLWMKAAQHGHLQAHVELAKCYEHRYKDYPQAKRWTQNAIQLVDKPETSGGGGRRYEVYKQQRWLAELEHRLARLQRKVERSEEDG